MIEFEPLLFIIFQFIICISSQSVQCTCGQYLNANVCVPCVNGTYTPEGSINMPGCVLCPYGMTSTSSKCGCEVASGEDDDWKKAYAPPTFSPTNEPLPAVGGDIEINMTTVYIACAIILCIILYVFRQVLYGFISKAQAVGSSKLYELFCAVMNCSYVL